MPNKSPRWKLAYEDEGGSILLYGDPSPVHEGTRGFVAQLIVLELGRVGGLDGGKAMRLSPSPVCQLVDSRKEPDFSFKPKDCKQYSPTLVCEIAYHNESMEELRRELSRWTATADLAQMCFGIFGNTEPGGAALDPYLTVVWKSHGSRHQQLSFGKGTACRAPNVPQYQFKFPFDKLFARSGLVNVFGHSNHISIDLFEVREEIQDILCNMPSVGGGASTCISRTPHNGT